MPRVCGAGGSRRGGGPPQPVSVTAIGGEVGDAPPADAGRRDQQQVPVGDVGAARHLGQVEAVVHPPDGGVAIRSEVLVGEWPPVFGRWDQHKPRFIDNIIKWLFGRVVPDLAGHVQIADCATPLDFERRIGLGQGGLRGLVQDLAHTTVFRPSNRSTCIDGLYLAGSSTNPGGGVPTVIASGTITASLIDRFET